MAVKRGRTHHITEEGPSTKRNRTGHAQPSFNISVPLTFNHCFSDEIVLHIFSYLDYKTLCVIQTVDSHWARLANDNTLWKRLFLQDHPSQRLRGARGFSSRWVTETAPGGGREIKPLPARLALADNQIYYYPFKWMYRVSRNWKNGRCSYERLQDTDASDRLRPISPHGVPSACRPSRLILAGDILIYASSSSIFGHALVIKSPAHPVHSIPCQAPITCLTLDHSPTNHSLSSRSSDVHVACFYSDGQFSIFSVPLAHPTRTVESVRSLRPQNSRLGHPSVVYHAVYRHPLLVTMSQELDLSIWDIAASGRSPILPIHTYRSYTSFPPLCISLSSAPSSDSSGELWKLLLVYCTGVYPSHWLPSASELTLSRASSSHPFTITSSRKAKSLIAAHGWISDDERTEMEAEWSRKMGAVDAIETDGKFLVAAAGAGDNTLQVYRLHYRGELRLSYLKTLEGHPAGVAALKLADGRCVGVGSDGGLKVWDLEAGWDVEVEVDRSATLDGDGDIDLMTSRLADVAFDEKRVVSLDGDTGSVNIWSFDL